MSAGHPPEEPEDGTDGLFALTAALAEYLQEVDDDYRTCLRHEGSVVVSSPNGILTLTRAFPPGRASAAHVRRTAGQLPDWKQSPFWRERGRDWVALGREPPTGPPGRRLLFSRGLAWAGRPVLVRLSASEAGQELDLLLPAVGTGVRELPLRTVAQGLRCHAHLLPDRVAAPLPSRVHPGTCSVREYLTRATPQNLYASQCFSTPRAEQ